MQVKSREKWSEASTGVDCVAIGSWTAVACIVIGVWTALTCAVTGS